MKTKQLAINSMLAAMCAVLGYVSLDMGNVKVTLESLPVLLGALLFGPADGALIGLVGTFVYQLLRYGFSATTLLWMLPCIIGGLIAGFYAKKKNFSLSFAQTVFIALLCEFVVTVLNTGVMYVDSKIYGYYSYAYIFGSVSIRFLLCIGRSVVYALVLPPLLSVPSALLSPMMGRAVFYTRLQQPPQEFPAKWNYRESCVSVTPQYFRHDR